MDISMLMKKFWPHRVVCCWPKAIYKDMYESILVYTKSRVNVYKTIGHLVYQILQTFTLTHCSCLFKQFVYNAMITKCNVRYIEFNHFILFYTSDITPYKLINTGETFLLKGNFIFGSPSVAMQLKHYIL